MSSYVVHAFPTPFIVTETGSSAYVFESVIVDEISAPAQAWGFTAFFDRGYLPPSAALAQFGQVYPSQVVTPPSPPPSTTVEWIIRARRRARR